MDQNLHTLWDILLIFRWDVDQVEYAYLFQDGQL